MTTPGAPRAFARIVLAAALLCPCVALRAQDLPTQLLPVYGGGGGTAFSRSCAGGYALTGLRYRMGAGFDAVGILCRPVLSDGTLGPETTVGTLAGGSGGTSKVVDCPAGQVVSGAEIMFATYVGQIYVYCRPWNAGTRTFGGSSTMVQTDFDLQPFKQRVGEFCESSHQPAHGIRGRAASLVDAVGFVCNEP